MAHRQADRVLSPTATEPEVSAHSGNAPLRSAAERLAWNAALDRAAKIAGPVYARHDGGSSKWRELRLRMAGEITACKVENGGA